MLDDINSELISIYPGTFPNPRPFSRKPQVFDSGFHTYIRPPLPLYRIQCNTDYIAEKSKKAEAAIRKLYKAAATSSTATFKESNTIFQHDHPPEAMTLKYRDTQIFTKSRLRKVNRRQLLKATSLMKKKDEDESNKQHDSSVSKIYIHSSSSRKWKQKIFGAVKLEPKSRNRAGSAAEEEKSLKQEVVAKPSTYPNSEIKTKGEAECKEKGPLTVRRPMKKSCEVQRKKPERSGSANSIVENLLKEEEGEGRKLKEGNYTKIVTFRKKLFKPQTPVEISSFPFTDQLTGRFGALQKMRKESGNNEIEHLYKINELDRSLGARSSSARQDVGSKRVVLSDTKLDQVREEAKEEKPQVKKDLLRMYGVTQTMTTTPPVGLQVKEAQSLVTIKSDDKPTRYRVRKPPKKEAKFLLLPKVTPSLGVDPPKAAARKNTMRLGVLPTGTKSLVTFVNIR